MSLDSFRSIADQIAPYTDHLCFHVKGEPLLHPELGSFLDLCHEKCLKVNLTTNGTLIQHSADMLLSKPALRQINFSLHSFSGNEQSENKDEYLGKIFAYINRSVSQTDAKISLRLWNHGQIGSETNVENKNCEVLRQIERAFHLPDRIIEKINTGQGIKIAEKVFLSLESVFEWPSMAQKEDSVTGFCHALKSQSAILVDGTVVPCCLDADGIMNLGNIKSSPFSEIIEGERAKMIYRAFQNRRVAEALCRKCTYRKRFD